MIFGFGILATALLLSIVAAYYSVAGLTAIFSAATIPVIIMGGSLELGKIVATVWLHNNWKRAGWVFKAYLIPAVAFLMLLTSMGIFGYLSKAHSDQSLVSGDSVAKVAIYDEKIKIAKENIDANRKALKQMDEAVDQVMGRSTTETGADKAVAIRRAQQKERGRLLAEIQAEQKTITSLSEERAPIAAEFRKIEAEVGPIKYIAALVYGDNPDANVLEKSVRLVIILIVLVFDPLALTLILAANKQFEWARQGRGGFVHDEPAYPKDDGPLDQATLDALREQTKEELPTGKVVVKDELFPTDPSPPGWMYNTITTTYPSTEQEVEEVIQEFDRTKHPYLDKPFVHFENLKPMVAKSEAISEPVYVDMPDFETQADDYGTPEEKAAMQHWKELNPGETLKSQRNMFERGEIDELPWMQYLKPAPNSSFGPTFPDAPARGDSFVRTDVAPNQLFKFNGDRWILVDKATADNYTYDTAYIDHLIDKINSGSYDVDLLSASEQEQVAQRLQTKTNNT
jgi:hypothetical protein